MPSETKRDLESLGTKELQHSLEKSIKTLTNKLEREMRALLPAERLSEIKSDELSNFILNLMTGSKAKAELWEALNSSRDGISLTNQAGEFIYSNHAHAGLFGYEITELLGRHWSTLYNSQHFEHLEPLAPLTDSSAGSWRGEMIGVSKYGDQIVHDLAIAVRTEGGFCFSTRDVEARKRPVFEAIELERKLRDAERKAAIQIMRNAVAHDFNNVIGSISSYAAILAKELPPNTRLSDYASRISAAAERASAVLSTFDDELEPSRKMQEFDLAALLQQTVELISDTYPPDIQIKYEGPLSFAFHGDENIFSRTLFNMLKNGVEALEDAGLIKVSLSREEPHTELAPAPRESIGELRSDVSLWLAVEDNGKGIRESRLRKIFDPYFSTKTGLLGRGLGLMSLRELAQSHDAFVEVISRVDAGTVFRIALPSKLGSHVAENHEPRSRISLKVGSKILVVDDEPEFLEAICDWIMHLDLRPVPITNGSHAARRLKLGAEEFGAIVTDLTMPGLSGDELLKIVRDTALSVPVILVSGNPDASLVKEQYDRVLRKPLTFELLRKALFQ